MMRYFSCFLIYFSIFNIVSFAQAQWWGSESLPGNPGFYTYKTRFGYWQYGALERNIATPRRFAAKGIVRDWNDGSIIAVDRNVPGNRFAQQGVPNLVYVPQIDFFDSYGDLTDVRYRSGLRQIWPEDQQLLNHEWEQITYESEQLPPRADRATGLPVAVKSSRKSVVASPQEPQNRVQAIMVQQIPGKTAQPPKQNYHQRIMQGHAERRAAEEERIRQYAEQKSLQDELIRHEQVPDHIPPLWFREQAVSAPVQPPTVMGRLPGYEVPVMTYPIPVNPVAEQEKRLEYVLAYSPDISFYSPFQVKIENGTVRVSGVVGSEEQRQVAEHLLRNQPGVQQVQNNLTIFD